MNHGHLGIALVSAAGLLLQLALTRVFSVTQWYHFAFMAVGLGLLGFGASGTALAVVPALLRSPLWTAAWSALAVVPAVALALAVLTLVPFDAYLLALQPRQLLYLAAQVTALILPFLGVGLAVGVLLAAFPERANTLYAASFLGAAWGAAAATVVLQLGGAGSMVAAAAVAAAGAGVLGAARPAPGAPSATRLAVAAALLAVAAAAGAVVLPPDLPLSPYKALNQLRRLPDARVEYTGRNAVSRVDVVRSPALRSAPGLSYLYPGAAPPLPGATVDGDGPRALPAAVDAAFTDYLPTAAAYRLTSGRVLVVGVSLEVLSALAHRASSVTVVEGNSLLVEAARRFGGEVLRPRGRGGVRVVTEAPRTYLRRSPGRFQVIQVPPPESFQVVASGTYSMAEHYLYTVEAFGDYMRRLAPGGVLVVSRWVQTPPSEEVRVWAAAVAALEEAGQPAADRLAALRSLNTLTVLVKPGGFTASDVAALRAFASARRFDITYAPGLPAALANRYHVLPVDMHREAFTALLDPQQRRTFLRRYAFEVGPIRDDRPFFFQFFRWSQVPQILAGLGRTWQPFGGGGYLVLLALLLVLGTLAAGLILAPLRLRPGGLPATSGPAAGRLPRAGVLAYFLALGFAYLFVEVPLLQQMVLLLGFPTYAVAAILAMLLVASGLGSLAGSRWRPAASVVLPLLAAAIVLVAWTLPRVLQAGLGLPAPARVAVIGTTVIPLGILMGMPFPAGIRFLGVHEAALVPWAWGINGCASVVGAVVAAILQLQWGFRAVLVLGGLVYLGAGLVAMAAGAGSVATAGPGGRRARTPGW
ncbi:MAG: hypothetical protein QN152_02590 [Armatimonadota bacterium]|nr:hypothetical protein [Armatimonadota bacterium]MDR7428084.1 hypothetical protein [Armatimonadota bacterium]MDR7469686.1 hypothetical protein [Armatimonadota bacterium]MDR7476057.1 hypothetical protein [Armatimonadota bacterium]MDR7538405.1 hypothetical protein [Armatimonadota bacterium]